MKFINLKTVLIVCCMAIFFVACKKSTDNNNTVVEEALQARVQTDDAAMVDGETESTDDDVNNAAASSERFCGAGNFNAAPFILADATITLPVAGTANRITIVYNGNVAPGTCRKRTGTITVDLLNAARWVEAGAVLKYTFINFKVENTCTNRSVTINGERTVTNVRGGNLFRLHSHLVDSLQHKVRNGAVGLEATFTDSSGTKTAMWNVARNTVIRNIADTYFFTATGDTTIGVYSNTESWGTTRFGTAYQTVISGAVKANTNCKLWKPTAGEVVHHVGNFTSTIKFGLNASGNPVGPGDCATNFRVTWVAANGATNTNLLTYR